MVSWSTTNFSGTGRSSIDLEPIQKNVPAFTTFNMFKWNEIVMD
jgi:hypothetical protein